MKGKGYPLLPINLSLKLLGRMSSGEEGPLKCLGKNKEYKIGMGKNINL